MKLKILMLPENHYPTSHSVLEEVFAEILKDRGHEITWVMQSYTKLSGYENVLWKKTQVYITMSSPGKSRYDRLTNHVLGCVGKIYILHKITKMKKFDIIQVKEGLFEGLLALYFKKRNGTPFSFQYTFPAQERRLYESKKKIARYQKIYYVRAKMSKPILMWILRNADLVLAVSRSMKEELIQNGVPSEKMMIFPMGINPSNIPEETRLNAIKNKFQLNSNATVIYVGAMDRSRNLEFLLRTIVIVKEQIHNIRLLMVGDGIDRKRLENLSESLHITDNIIFTGHIPRSQVTEFIASADVGVSPIPPIPIYRVGSATKTVEYMAMKKPVVCNDIADQEEVISCSGGGMCVHYDEKQFAQAIVELLNNPQKAKEMGEMGRDWVIKNRNYEILAHNLEQRYFDLVQSKSI